LTTVWVSRRHGKKGTGATVAANPDLTVNSLAELVAIHKFRSSVEASLSGCEITLTGARSRREFDPSLQLRGNGRWKTTGQSPG
jgi:hypothetical protein